jgi:hypothetical protein
VHQAIGSHPSVKAITLIGSRARGDATSLSDWDFQVDTETFDEVEASMPQLVEPLHPLASLWDPLSHFATFMSILPGPTKVDFLFIDQPVEQKPPHKADADTLRSIDTHFWDWCLWLTSKVAKDKTDLVRDELDKMSGFLLEPLGITEQPKDLTTAVRAYTDARARHESRFGVEVPRALGSEVERVVQLVENR